MAVPTMMLSVLHLLHCAMNACPTATWARTPQRCTWRQAAPAACLSQCCLSGSLPFAGVGPTEFTTSLNFAKTAKGRIAVDSSLRVLQAAGSPGTEEQLRRPEDVSLSWD